MTQRKGLKGNGGDYVSFRSQKQHPVSNLPWVFFPSVFNFPLTHKAGTSSQEDIHISISSSPKTWNLSTKFQVKKTKFPFSCLVTHCAKMFEHCAMAFSYHSPCCIFPISFQIISCCALWVFLSHRV